MKIVRRLLLVLLIGIFLFGCGGKKSGIDGKVVDGQGQPIPGIKITIKQVQPVKGYELFETTTGSDGIFRFDGVMPVNEYVITPSSDKWKSNVTMKVTTGTAGQTVVLNNPMVIRYNVMRDGSVIDTKSGLQWLIYAGTDLASDSVRNTVKNIKEGGFTDWRLPTKSELASLQEKATASGFLAETDFIHEACCAWTGEPNTDNIEWDFYIDDGNDLWASSKIPSNDRVVVVRAAVGAPTVTPAAPAVVPVGSTVPPVAVATQAPAAPAPAAPAAAVPAPAIVEKKEAPAPAKAIAPPVAPVPIVEKKEVPVKEPVAKKKEIPAKKEAVAPAPAPKKESAKKASVKESAAPKAAPAEKVDLSQIGNNIVVHFSTNKSVIAPEDMAKLKAFFAKIKGSAGKLVIEGHADSTGSASGKLKISIDRALKIMELLKKMGLSDKIKVELKGIGDAKAAAENDSEEGRKLNRRVELNFIPE